VSLPTVDLTDRPTRASGVAVERVGALVRVTLPCGATAMLTHDQAVELSARLVSARNDVAREAPGGAS
jgi:hypothetical protein